MDRQAIRRGLVFVVVSGGGWLIDLAIFMALSGPAGWAPVYANIVSGSCGALFVFGVSSRGIFERNTGPMVQKVTLLLLFNLAVIVACSFVLAWIAQGLATLAVVDGVDVAPALIRLAAKVVVTPMTLILNFIVIRFLLERFVSLLQAPAVQPVPPEVSR